MEKHEIVFDEPISNHIYDKNSNEIGLVVVWETGNDYEGNYKITYLLDDDNLSLRQYHGITHVMTNLNCNRQLFL